MVIVLEVSGSMYRISIPTIRGNDTRRSDFDGPSSAVIKIHEEDAGYDGRG